MGLVEIAGIVSGFGEGCLAGGFCNKASQADDGGVLFWGSPYGRPESFFKGVLADVEGGCQLFYLQAAIVLPDQLECAADEGIRAGIDQVLEEEGLYEIDPIPVGGGFGETLQRLL